MVTSRQHCLKQSRSGAQRNVKRSSRVMRGHLLIIVSSTKASDGMCGLLVGTNVGSEVGRRPDGQRPAVAGFRVYTIPVRRGGIVVFKHPFPAANEIGTVVLEADV